MAKVGNRRTRRDTLKIIGGTAAMVACPTILAGRKSFASDGVVSFPVGALLQAGSHAAAMEAVIETDIAKKNGLQIKQLQYNAGANLLQGMAAGDVVAGVCGCNPTLISIARGVKVKILANANREGSLFIVAKDIKSPKDLNGRVVATPGVASIQDGLLRTFEKQHGIKTQHSFVKITDMPIMLRNGEVAGYILWEISATAGLAMGGGKVLATSRDIAADHECCSLIASEAFLKEKPEEAKRLVKAYNEGYKLITSDKEQVARIVSKKDGIDLETTKRALDHVKYRNPPFNNVEELARVTKALIESKVIEASRVTDVDVFIKQAVDNSLLRQFVG